MAGMVTVQVPMAVIMADGMAATDGTVIQDIVMAVMDVTMHQGNIRAMAATIQAMVLTGDTLVGTSGTVMAGPDAIIARFCEFSL